MRPVTRLGSTCHRPEAVCIELSMPFELPQLFKPHPLDRPVHENRIYCPIMPVDTEMLHFMASTRPLTIELRRSYPVGPGTAVLVDGPASPPHRIGKNRYLISAFGIHRLPVPFNRTVVSGSTVEPNLLEPPRIPLKMDWNFRTG